MLLADLLIVAVGRRGSPGRVRGDPEQCLRHRDGPGGDCSSARGHGPGTQGAASTLHHIASGDASGFHSSVERARVVCLPDRLGA